MKIIVIMFLGLILNENVYAHCTEQNQFKINWTEDKSNVNLTANLKNNKEVFYYPIDTNLGSVLTGFFITDMKYIVDNKKDYGSLTFIMDHKDTFIKDENNNMVPQYTPISVIEEKNYQEILEKINKLISGEGRYFNYSFISQYSNTITKIPLSEYQKEVKKTFTYKFSSNYIGQYENLTKKMVYGNHKIKYYVILLHSDDAKKCSYFESPEIEYDFGMKPLSLVWKDFWNK